MSWGVAAKLAVSAALLAWLVARVELAQVVATLAALDAPAVALALLLTLLAWALSALRLWLLLEEVRLRDVARMTLVGVYYQTVLPGQVAGDAVKAYRLSVAQVAAGEAAAATLVDRAFALVALLLTGAVAARLAAGVPKALAPALDAAVVVALACAAVALHPRSRSALLRIAASLPWARIRELPARLANGLDRVLQRRRALAANVAAALAFHVLCIAVHACLGPALGISLPFAHWAVVYACVSVLLLLPVSVAGLGLREGGYMGLLGLFGVASEPALSLSLVLFGFLLLGASAGLITELAAPRVQPRPPA